MELIKRYFVYAQTGCSCCSDSENTTIGPYHSLQEAEDSALQLHSVSFVCSQYSKNGRYTIQEMHGYTIDIDGTPYFLMPQENAMIQDDNLEYYSHASLQLGYSAKIITTI